MIAKNEAGNLEACLGSVAGLFDVIVVIDASHEGDRAPHSGAYVVRCACDPGRMGMGGRRWSIISGFFRCARRCAGRTESMGRSCRR
jgi:hypothetical protein